MAEIKRLSTELQVKDKLLDTSGDAGTSGQILSSTGTGTNWITLTSAQTTGATFSGNIILDDNSGASPNIQFINEDGNSWYIYNDSNGKFQVQQNSTIRATFSSGDLELTNDLVVNGGTLQLGSDVTLFRDGANILRTDDVLHANGHIHVGGVSGGGSIYNRADTTNNITFSSTGLAISKNTTFAGNVGIGETTPLAPLHVVGDIRLANANGSNPTDAGTLMFAETGGTWGSDMYGFRINQNGSANYLQIQSANTSTVQTILALTRDTARVGIGTVSPSAKLHLSGSDSTASAIRQSRVGTVIWDQAIDSSGRLQWGTRSSEGGTRTVHFTVDDSGDVGIGTGAPGTSLDIVGVGARSLRVKSDSSASIIIDSDGDNDGTAGSYLHYRDTGGTKWSLYKETNNDFYLYNAAASKYPIHAKAGGDIVLMEDGNNLGVGVSSPSYKLEVGQDTDGTANLLMLRNSDSTYAQTWAFQSDTNKDLVITGSSGAGGFKFVPGSRGSTFTGDVTVTGDLNVTGDINSVSVTDLDVTDKTITVGVGQTAANSGSSGILISRSDAADPSMLWNQSTSRFDFNSGLTITGQIHTTGSVNAKGSLFVIDTDGTNNHVSVRSNGTEGYITVNNGSNWGLIMRGPVNDPRIGAYYGGVLKIEGFHTSAGGTGSNSVNLAEFDFANERFLVNGDIRINNYTGANTGGGGQTTYAGGLSIFENSGTAALFMGIKNASYANRGWSFKATEVGVNSKLELIEHGLSGTRLTIASGGDATFAGDVTISNATPALNLTDTDNSSNIALSSVGGALIVNSTSDQVYQIGGTEYFRIATSGATFAGDVSTGGVMNVVGGDLKLDLGRNIRFGNQLAIIKESNGELKFYGGTNSTDGGFEFFTWDGSAYNSSLTLKNDNNATFAGNISIPVNKKLYFGGGSHTYIGEDIDDRLRFFVGGAEFLRFTEDTADTIFICQNAKPLSDSTIDLGATNLRYANIYADNVNSSTVSVSAGALSISGDGSNAVTLTESGSGDFTIDAPDDIRLDAGGADIVLKSGGTEYSRLTFNNPGLNIQATQSNASIYLSPNGTGNVYASTDSFIISATEGEDAKLLLRADEGDDDGDDWYITNTGSGGSLQFTNDKTGSQLAHLTLTPQSPSSSAQSTFAGNVTVANNLISNSKVGIGNTAPNKKLVIKSSGADDGINLRRNSNDAVIATVIETGSGDGALLLASNSGSTTSLLRGTGTSYINGGTLYVGRSSDYFGSATTFQVDSGANNQDVGFHTRNFYIYSYANGSDANLIFGDGTANFGISAGDTDFRVYNYGTTSNALTILKSNNNATFAGAVSLTGGALSISGDGSNAATLTETGAGLLTIAAVDDVVIDSGSDITLDAAGNDIRFFKSGVEYGKFKQDSNNFDIFASVENKDIRFKGNDAGTTVTALTLDMSDQGWAHFNTGIAVGNSSAISTFAGRVSLALANKGAPSYTFTGDTNTGMYSDSADSIKFTAGGNDRLLINLTSGKVDVVGSLTVSSDIEDRDIPCIINTGWGDDSSTTSNLMVPLGNTVDDVSTGAKDGEHTFVAPYAGKLVKIIMKNTNGSLSSSFTTELKYYVNGSSTATSGELTASSDAITWAPTSNNTFVAGDEINIIYQKSAGSKYWREVSMTIVIELTDYDI